MLTLFSVAVKTWQFSFQVASDKKVKRKALKTKQIFPSQGPIMKARNDDASECCGVTVLIDETSFAVPSHDSIQCGVQGL